MSLQKVKEQIAVDLFGGPLLPNHCVCCKQPFTGANVHTKAGWRETKISRLCEDCWDSMFSSNEDFNEPDRHCEWGGIEKDAECL